MCAPARGRSRLRARRRCATRWPHAPPGPAAARRRRRARRPAARPLRDGGEVEIESGGGAAGHGPFRTRGRLRPDRMSEVTRSSRASARRPQRIKRRELRQQVQVRQAGAGGARGRERRAPQTRCARGRRGSARPRPRRRRACERPAPARRASPRIQRRVRAQPRVRPAAPLRRVAAQCGTGDRPGSSGTSARDRAGPVPSRLACARRGPRTRAVGPAAVVAGAKPPSGPPQHRASAARCVPRRLRDRRCPRCALRPRRAVRRRGRARRAARAASPARRRDPRSGAPRSVPRDRPRALAPRAPDTRAGARAGRSRCARAACARVAPMLGKPSNSAVGREQNGLARPHVAVARDTSLSPPLAAAAAAVSRPTRTEAPRPRRIPRPAAAHL